MFYFGVLDGLLTRFGFGLFWLFALILCFCCITGLVLDLFVVWCFDFRLVDSVCVYGLIGVLGFVILVCDCSLVLVCLC